MQRPINTIEELVGNTIKLTWVNSGAAPTLIYSRLLDPSQAMVNCVAAVSSGNGFYYALNTTPSTPGIYPNEWTAWVNSVPYLSRQYVRALGYEG